MKTLLVSLFFVFLLIPVTGTSPPSNLAPDFKIRDTKGVEHQLYQYLNEGKSVILNFSSTWCKPCWNYKELGILDKVYTEHGPDGSNEVVILFLEADQNTCEDCLYGQEKCNDFTYGNWASNTYPTSNLEGENSKILETYNVTRFPSIYAISGKDLSVSNLGQLSLLQWKIWISEQKASNSIFNISQLPIKALNMIEELEPRNINHSTRKKEAISSVSSLRIKLLEELETQVYLPVNFQLYPNPCHHKLFIKLDNSVSKKIKVTAFDSNGKRVFKKNTKAKDQRISIDLKSVNRGAYIFILESEYQSWSKKIFIVD